MRISLRRPLVAALGFSVAGAAGWTTACGSSSSSTGGPNEEITFTTDSGRSDATLGQMDSDAAPTTHGAGGDDAGESDGSSATPGDDGSANVGDTGVDSGTAPLSCAGLTYCDDFERYDGGAIANNETLGPWVATVNGTSDAGAALTTMRVDSMRASSGTKSLHVTIPLGNPARGTLHQMSTTGLVAGNDVYGRAMVFYSNAGGANVPFAVHSWIFNATGTSTAAGGAVDLNLGGGGGSTTIDEWQLNFHPPTPTDGGKATESSVVGGSVTAGAWHCVQWQFDGAGSPVADTAKIWVDGTVVAAAPDAKVPASSDWQMATPWSAFDFGFNHYQNTINAIDVSLDDFALDESMIPCP